MNELIITILTTFSELGIDVDEQVAKYALEMSMAEYTISKKSYELVSATNIPELAKTFLAIKKFEGIANSTLTNYTSVLRTFCAFMTKNIEDVELNDLRKFIAYRMENMQAHSIEPIVYCIKSFFSWLVDQEYLVKNPAKKLNPPKIKRVHRDPLSIEEIEQCRNACETPRERAILEFLLATGCRICEVIPLNYEEVMSGAFKVLGKGGKERYCFINDRAKLYLRVYMKSRCDGDPALFVTSRGKIGRLGEKMYGSEIRKIAKRTGIHIHPHRLRHTYATFLLEAGASLTTVQDLLGHNDPNTTQIYAKLSHQSIKNEYQKYAAAI